jgi:hypothetical protein
MAQHNFCAGDKGWEGQGEDKCWEPSTDDSWREGLVGGRGAPSTASCLIRQTKASV